MLESMSDFEQPACADNEPFALMNLGDSMAPEFLDGDVLTIDPSIPPQSGHFVVAQWQGEYSFRQLLEEQGQRYLVALNPAYERVAIDDSCRFAGVVSQRSRQRDIKRLIR